MKPGRYIAIMSIPLSLPFEACCIKAGETFDVLDANAGDGFVLISYEGEVAWKYASSLKDRALWSYLPPELGYHPPPKVVKSALRSSGSVKAPEDFAVFAKRLGVSLCGDVTAAVGHTPS
jgi:hypothetical protein